MGLKTFKGGVHPKDGKDLSKSKPIKELLPEGELVFPLTASVLMKDLSLTAVRNCKFLPTLCPISILTSIRHAAA